jgi:hypothetical protein
MNNYHFEPYVFFLVSFALLWFFAWLGASRFTKIREQLAQAKEDFRIIEGATLTLLALIIGFAFSMALERYDQRKNYEEAEANAIGTEYARADFLPPLAAGKVRALLLRYLEQRVLFYTTREADQIALIDRATTKLQTELWTAITVPANSNPTPVVALVVSGMNDVLNSQGYTQAAWWNRIPLAAWAFMFTISVCATLLVGIGSKNGLANGYLLPILPTVISIAFFLIADIDSPRRGMIQVVPQNLVSLAQSLQTP